MRAEAKRPGPLLAPGIDSKKIAGLRDILIHEYFGIDSEIVWDVVQHKLPTLETAVPHMLNDPH